MSRGDPEEHWAYWLAQMVKVSIVAYLVGGAFQNLAYWDVPYYLFVAIAVTRWSLTSARAGDLHRGTRDDEAGSTAIACGLAASRANFNSRASAEPANSGRLMRNSNDSTSMSAAPFIVTQDELMAVFRQKYSRTPSWAGVPQMRLEFDYFTPDDHYEALVGKLLAAEAEWCDVGCGRNIFPDNPELASQYAARCAIVFGIDPDDNVRENTFVNEYFQGFVEDCPTEHRVRPGDPAHGRRTHRIPRTCAGSPRPIAEAERARDHLYATQMGAHVDRREHHPVRTAQSAQAIALELRGARYLSDPVQAEHAHRHRSIRQAWPDSNRSTFERLDDCRITNSYRLLNRLELVSRSALHTVGIPYPEACILTVLRLQQRQSSTSVN